MRAVVGRFCFLVVSLAASGAQAWTDGPVCAARAEDPQSLCRASGGRLSLSESGELCFPDSLALDGTSDAPSQADWMTAARKNMQAADALYKAGKLEDALLHLRAVEQEPLRVTDRIALRRGELLRELEMPEQACEAFAIAAQSPDREVAVRAQIGSVYCSLEASDRKAEGQLQALLGRYPYLTQRESLSFALALARERWGNATGAAALLRRIDLERPATPTAARARVELARLREQGVKIEPYNWREQVLRAERLLHSGPVEDAAAAVEAMRDESRTNPSLRVQMEQLETRIARLQGRFDAPQQGATALVAVAPSAAPGSEADPRSVAERRIQAVRGNRSTPKLSAGQVRQLLELAFEYDDAVLATEMLGEVAARRAFAPDLRFMLGLRASGIASDESVAELFGTLLDTRGYQLAARYYRARALDHMARNAEAQVEYQTVIANDNEGYYAMWANIQLASMRERNAATCEPEAKRMSRSSAHEPMACGLPRAAAARPVAAAPRAAVTPEPMSVPEEAALRSEEFAARDELSTTREERATRDGEDDSLQSTQEDEPFSFDDGAVADGHTHGAWKALPHTAVLPGTAAAGAPRVTRAALEVRDPAARRVRALELLAPLAQKHGEAFPWLLRAQELVELERFDEAADELSEAYIAWRDAKGSAPIRSGLLSLLTGAAPPRRPASPQLRRARLELDEDARLVMSELATLLGDAGIGFRLGADRDFLPRAYSDIVESAAKKYGVDPNLLFAVMRVESVFNRRILSHVGAVGLMQIMPHTGQRIAYRLGIDDFEPTQLLTPQRNLEFSAWYLASLTRRFDGRLPLAIAAYNGGPHNVRLWLRNNRPDMPLDAFLERIPFKETNKYVRRVLSFYALYRAQQNLPAAPLMVQLPELRPDPLAF